jgi:hypothetical protein
LSQLCLGSLLILTRSLGLSLSLTELVTVVFLPQLRQDGSLGNDVTGFQRAAVATDVHLMEVLDKTAAAEGQSYLASRRNGSRVPFAFFGLVHFHGGYPNRCDRLLHLVGLVGAACEGPCD